jgi:glutamate-1-semialdehyde 2,1-aminomutase
MGAMNEFLTRVKQPEYQEIYQQADNVWNTRIAQLNQQLKEKNLPVKVANLHSICTVLYTIPSRYNWMFQFYLRSEGLAMSWIGSGRMIMSLNFTDEEFSHVSERFVSAAENMKKDEWWWESPQLTNKSIKQQMLKEMLLARFPKTRKIIKMPEISCPPDNIKEIKQP